MLHFFHQFLLRLPPELAHHTALFFLRLKQWWDFRVKKRVPSVGPLIRVASLNRLAFASRLGLAAGFDKNAEVFAELAKLGFGFIEVGTVTPKPQVGNPKPRIFRYPPHSLVNHLGFNNVGLELFRKNILRYRSCVKVPLFANIGKGRETPNESALDDYHLAIERLRDCVDAFVVNISSPNTPNLGGLQNVQFLAGLSRLLPTDIPTFVKFSPDLEEAPMRELLDFIDQSKHFSGVVLTNTSRSLAQSQAHRDVGGLSGAPLFSRALQCVSLARKCLHPQKVIIGVGGVFTVEDAKKMREAGADLIEIYTAFIYLGPSVVKELSSALS